MQVRGDHDVRIVGVGDYAKMSAFQKLRQFERFGQTPKQGQVGLRDVDYACLDKGHELFAGREPEIANRQRQRGAPF